MPSCTHSIPEQITSHTSPLTGDTYEYCTCGMQRKMNNGGNQQWNDGVMVIAIESNTNPEIPVNPPQIGVNLHDSGHTVMDGIHYTLRDKGRDDGIIRPSDYDA